MCAGLLGMHDGQGARATNEGFAVFMGVPIWADVRRARPRMWKWALYLDGRAFVQGLGGKKDKSGYTGRYRHGTELRIFFPESAPSEGPERVLTSRGKKNIDCST